MKLTKLTPEHEEIIARNEKKFIAKFLNSDPIDMDIAKRVIAFVYSLVNLEMPKITIAKDPLDAQKIANKLAGTKKTQYSFGSYLTIYWASFYAYYETYVDFGILTKENSENYFKLREYIESNIFLTIEFDTDIILVPKPKYIHRNEMGMHCTTGPAIEWEDGYAQYYINGRAMPESIFKGFTKEKFFNEENEDVRAGMYEVLEAKGEGTAMTFLGAEEVDRQTVTHLINVYSDKKNNSGTFDITGIKEQIEEMVLYKTKDKYHGEEDLNGNNPSQLTWLKLICPSTDQTYLIPSDASFNNCIEAAKYHRPDEVPSNIPYQWNNRS